MTTFTEKQRKFIENKAAGAKHEEAAIAAGYAPKAAQVAASKLMRRDDVKAAIEEAKKALPVATPTDVMPRTSYADPMHFLEDAMNNGKLPLLMRLDAAKCLLPYKHARMGELGKKASAKERAETLTMTSRFRTKTPPKFRTIDGGKET